MGKILAGALMPHPPLLIPEVGKESTQRVAATSAAMHGLAKELAALDPGVVIVLSPHGFSPQGYASLVAFEQLSGSMANFGAPECKLAYEIELELTERIFSAAREAGLEICKLSSELLIKMPQLSDLELDSGAFVPLYFLQQAGFSGKIVHICPGCLSLAQTKLFGELLAQAVEQSGQEVVLLASGDLSHYLKDTPPYGFRPEGVEFDEKVLAAICDNDLGQLFALEENLVQRAGECGLRSLTMVMAALPAMITEFYSYENSFGVGYAVAAWEAPGESLLTKTGPSLPVRLAKWALKNSLPSGRQTQLPAWSDNLTGRAGAFVSLKKHGELRGCIGTFLPQQTSLKEEIYNNTLAAAYKDPRFPPVQASEMEELEVSVDILSYPEKVSYLNELDAKKYGILVVQDEKSGLLLPDLEGVETVDEQLHIAMQKAGIVTGEKIDIYRFTVERYV